MVICKFQYNRLFKVDTIIFSLLLLVNIVIIAKGYIKTLIYILYMLIYLLCDKE